MKSKTTDRSPISVAWDTSASRIVLAVFVIGLLGSYVAADLPGATTPSQRKRAFRLRQKMHREGLFHDLAFRCVGPVVMSGRVVDIQPHPEDPYSFFVAYATGGLWKTENNGMRFTPLFEGYDAVALGALAVDTHDPNTIWLGTGEANSARSHYAGTGVYKTTDSGEHWACTGLKDSHHVGRILIHPEDSDTVFAAAMGHLYSENAQRGVFRTQDGGQTWKKVLYLTPSTGAIDISFDPSNPDILYAAMWEKVRRAWNIDESGPKSGIYKSIDGGDTWQRLEGFPQGAHIGRIGLAVAPSNPAVVYALLDNQAPRPDKEQYGDDKISRRKLPSMSKAEVLALTDKELESFMRRSGFHEDHTAEMVRTQLDANEISVQDLVDYTLRLDGGALTPVVRGAEVYRSDNAGRTWAKMNLTYLSMYNIAGYYFGQIRVAPDDQDVIYIMGVPLLKSEDGGRSYESIGGPGVHVDHHAMWIDPAHPHHIINGNDGGLNLSYDAGQTWQKLNYVPVGQFYAVNVDMAEPYYIYGGLQDNGTYKGSSRSVPNESAAWERVSGGDGFYIQIAPDFTTYAGSQFGHYSRIDTDGGWTRVRPEAPRMNEPAQRFNWQTPILLSTHSPNVLYYGSNRLFRSLDRGENLQPISPVMTSPEESGNVPYGTITTMAESHQTFGIIYVGTDDGRIHMTPDAGFSWQEIGNYLPSGLWCSRLECSHHTDGVVYMSLNAYRHDDFRTYLYRSQDFGQTWLSIKGNLPDESVNVIREDPLNPHVLYIGTDVGVFVSIDQGRSWEVLQEGMPISPAHDLAIHPRDRDLVVGTHGRSIYVMDIEAIQTLTPKVRQKAVHVFDLAWTRDYNRWDRKASAVVRKQTPDDLQFQYWAAQKGKAKITVKAKDERLVYEQQHDARQGINVLAWDLLVERDAELTWQLEQARKKQQEAQDKLDKAKKAAQEETEDGDKKSESEAPDSDEPAEDEGKKVGKLAELTKGAEEALDKLAAIQRVIDEVETYADQPQATRDRMVRKIYISEGTYTVTVKLGDDTATQSLQVGGKRKTPDKLDTKKKRAAETARLLKDYAIEK